jgi:hypothetical protein
VSHETALGVHRLGDVNPALIDLTVPLNFRANAPGLRLHRTVLPTDDIVERSGFLVTRPLRTLLDVAAGNLDVDLLAGAIRDALEAGLVARQGVFARADELGAYSPAN